MPVRRIGYACPLCEREGITAHLYEVPPAMATRCESNGDHVWTDSNVLRDMQPTKLDLPRPPVQPVNRVALTLQLPEQLMKNIQAKYGETLSENLIGVLQYCAQPQFLLIGSDDMERIQEKIGQQLNHGSEIYGALFRMSEEMVALKTYLKQLQRNQAVRTNGTGVLVDLADTLVKAVGKAEESGMPVDEYLGAYLREALTNDWVVI